ncbi:MAG: methyl-accepting chemotaxis protein [Candidatus Omnitrophica bacterium]|nr:methyl-accepting chemotaxis protein [Candidatus Omnitrophota bacterium]MDD5670196.1 methyl-accepting chemotaxis protein [Candidatus Omnitrophota bacterium]
MINKPLQFRYMAYFTSALIIISAIALVSLYIGIWSSILESFSDARLRNDLLLASRLTEYEQARFPAASVAAPAESPSILSFFKQTEKLSRHQREIFKMILDESNQKLMFKLALLLFFIAWASIYISHKIAGPLYRFHVTLGDIEKGDLTTRIHLRKFDEALFLAEQFNRAIEKLDRTMSQLKNIMRENEANPQRAATRLKEELSKIKTSADS